MSNVIVKAFNASARWLFFMAFIKPLIWVVFGLRVRNRPNIPTSGPAVIASNHNSHADTMILMAMFPWRDMHRVRPVAAADYWLRTPFLRWFSHNVLGVVPVRRQGENDGDPLQACYDSLNEGDILIFFPEGSRGKPEQLSEFKFGLAKLVEHCPRATVTPVFMHGTGKAMPRGSFLPMPFIFDVYVGKSLRWHRTRDDLMRRYERAMMALRESGNFPSFNI